VATSVNRQFPVAVSNGAASHEVYGSAGNAWRSRQRLTATSLDDAERPGALKKAIGRSERAAPAKATMNQGLRDSSA